MYPEDRVLVGVMPSPRDFEIAQEQHWYRVPVKHAPDGIHAEYIAFYFTRGFPDGLKWGVHYFARRTGHELARRVDLLPEQKQHPRAHEKYFKIQLAPLREKHPPIVSLRWRRITFIQTTWDRFVAAREINDLYSTDDQFVDRIYYALKRDGIQPDRAVCVRNGENQYTVDIIVPCKNGSVMVSSTDHRPPEALQLTQNIEKDILTVKHAINEFGGPINIDLH